MSLMYRPNIEEINNALNSRNPFKEKYFYDDTDKTHGLFKHGKMESVINNIFIYEKRDMSTIALLSELSIYGFKIIETMNHVLVAGSIADIIHLFKNCPDRNSYMNSMYEDLIAYYPPNYLTQLIQLGIIEEDKFSKSYIDTVINPPIDITLQSISLFHCDLITYSLNHHFDEIEPKNPDDVDGIYIKSRDNDNLLCNDFKDVFEKIDVSCIHLSKIMNISYFIYGLPLEQITDFINKNNIKKYTLYRTINIMGKTYQNVVLVTTSLYEFTNTYRLYKYDNEDLFESDNLSEGFKSIIDDMETLSNHLYNLLLNPIDDEYKITESVNLHSKENESKELIRDTKINMSKKLSLVDKIKNIFKK